MFEVNYILIALHAVSCVLFSIYPIRKLYCDCIRGRASFSSSYDDFCDLAVFAVLDQVSRIAQMVNARALAGVDLATISDATIVANVRISIYLDCISWLCGGISAASLVKHIVRAATGGDLIDCLEVFGRQVNPLKGLRVYRVVVFVLGIVFYSCWAILGMNSIVEYRLWRRYGIFFFSFAGTFVTPLIFLFFGMRLLTKLEHMNRVGAGSKGSEAQKKRDKIRMLKVGIYSLPLVVYWPTCLIMFFTVIANELWENQQSNLLTTKAIIEVVLWINSTYFSIYLIYKSIVFQSHSRSHSSRGTRLGLLKTYAVTQIVSSPPPGLAAPRSGEAAKELSPAETRV
ncbi:hypothetical protein HDV03_004643 [Kappamyces sp. JEL0829]|nr:hypothetical protein HDV03_004643 [Kappamyces sp. JEL0829]